MTNPLAWSGIKYPSFNKPMVDRVNPFSLLGMGKIDHSALPFLERLVLINRVFMGKHFDWYVTGEGCKGIIDLLIFPLISRILLYYMVKSSTPCALRVAAGVVGIPLEIARRLTSILLTIAVSPLVGLVHLAYKNLKNSIIQSTFRQLMSSSGPLRREDCQFSFLTNVRVT